MSFCKNVLFVIFFILLFEFFGLISPRPIFAFVDIKTSIVNFINTSINELPITFKDAEYKYPSTRFSQGETVFIKIQTSADGSKMQEAWFLGDSKEKLKELDLERTESRPYIYVGNLVLANSPGQYYLSVNIKDKETSFSYEQNIEITKDQEISPAATAVKEIYRSEEIAEKQENGVVTTLLNLITKIIQTVKSIFIKRA